MKNKKSPEPTVRTIDTQAYLTVLRELVEDGNSVSLNVSGMSMFPFLEHERDTVYFEAPKRKLRRGDIVFYQRSNGQYVMHRIYKVKGDEQTRFIIFTLKDLRNAIEHMNNVIFDTRFRTETANQ